MSAQIVTAGGISGGRRGIAGHVGKGPIIGVAIVALLLATLLGRHELTQPRSASHDANLAAAGVMGCNDEMRCLSMYASNLAASGGAVGSGCGDEMVYPWAYDPSTSTSTVGPRTVYRVSDSYYYVPVAGGIWEVVRYDGNEPPVIEDYVSGLGPANGIPVTP